ncbi:outer membrane beta-barrel protein [Neiella marina]|uniref:Outer membrane beta-barrel protein n=1 Tax=Neiella holothuriorum TaxID=2870530 RepID=A0ABS7EKI1_9GAMM|nr:outer membrane beta-barrel protein [Neiella holothuriorum]MBW8192187.1 outer membrane beta-barrel protein [Neiella holothuriorum]
MRSNNSHPISRRHYSCVIALLSGFVLAPAHSFDAGPYVGLKAGVTNFSDICSSHDLACDESDKALAAVAGYRWQNWWAVEVEYIDFGDASSYQASASIERDRLEFTGTNIAARANYTISEYTEVFGKLGAIYWEADTKGAQETVSDDGWQPSISVGADLQFYPSSLFRVEYQYFHDLGSSDVGSTDIHQFSLGVTYHF